MLDYRDIDICSLTRLISLGDVHVEELTDLTIKKTKEYQHLYFPWVTFDEEFLRRQAAEAAVRLKVGAPVRTLEGIPIGIKDTFNTADLPTQMGSPLWKNFTPGNDARIVYEARRAGGLVAGKTVTAEFAVHALNETLNPHDISRTPGTSSSGSAVAVSLGIVPVALGSQTAGSIIRPASFCGVYGFKPSFGTIARTGTLKTTDSLDTLGFFTACPEDLRLIFDQLRVRGRDYHFVHKYLDNNERDKLEAYDLNKSRIGFARTYTWQHSNEYARNAIEKICRTLSDSGFQVEDIELPVEFEEIHQLHSDIYNFSLAYYFKLESISRDKISASISALIEKGNAIPLSKYREGLQKQEKLCKLFDQKASEFDVILSLSTAGSAPLRGVEEKPDPSLLWNFLHLPALSAPVFTCPQSCPFGLQIIARRFNDYRLLDFIESISKKGLITRSPQKVLKHH
jgi:Asp-tRNA(Asn)/Glu-tRNA(Gln) amidotransferase A subunit family amidase